jgi:hypothetical protein
MNISPLPFDASRVLCIFIVVWLREAEEAHHSFYSACRDRVAVYKIKIVATSSGGD